jgi:hypothetical protein
MRLEHRLRCSNLGPADVRWVTNGRSSEIVTMSGSRFFAMTDTRFTAICRHVWGSDKPDFCVVNHNVKVENAILFGVLM